MSVERREVRNRIASTRRIRQVTGAMQKVASARLAHDRRAMEQSRLYTERLVRLLRELSFAADGARHPLLAKPRGGGAPAALVVFGADRGLCGGYHHRLVDALAAFRAEQPEGAVLRALVVGTRTARRIAAAGVPCDLVMPQPKRTSRMEPLDRLTDRVSDGFLAGRYGAAYALYTRFVSGLNQAAVVERLLPPPCAPPRRGRFDNALFEPDAGTLLSELLGQFVRQTIDFQFLSALASENAARQEAMSRATENAAEVLTELELRYRRLRQEDITTEMLEIASGGFETA
jgi:F-type H+-transporting ATPase subunit gamma